MTQPRSAFAPLALLLAFALSACGTNPYTLPDVETGKPAEEQADAEQAPPAPSTEPPVRESATAANNTLLARADEARVAGDYDRALAYLERAQRIDPDDAGVYLALARTHAEAGNSTQARAVAERGLLYCSDTQVCNGLRTYVR